MFIPYWHCEALSKLNEIVEELQPWLVIVGDAPDTSLALWRIREQEQLAVAMFSNRELAEEYAANHCGRTVRVERFSQMGLTQVLIDSYRRGIRYAALNPTADQVQQLFVISQVLKAAKEQLRELRDG